jgi:hypothetical protein
MSSLQLRNLYLLILVAITATGCDAIASIFQAGMWVGVLIVVVILGLIGLVVGRTRR